MKKFLLLLSISFFTIASEACDICGCGVGNYYIGIIPQFNHRFFGLRYHFSSFHTRLNDDPTQFSNDFYQSIEAWAGMNLGKKFQLLAFLPYNINHQSSDEGIVDRKGLGDISLLVNYNLLSIKNKNSSQQLWIGGGVKLPTGKFEIENNDPDVAAIANGQLGSGSTDILLNAMHTIRMNKFGVNTSATYKINGSNKEDYRFGNKFSANSFVYYTVPVCAVVVSPNLGLLYEHNDGNKLNNAKIDLTGGYSLNASAGAELSFRKMAVGFNVQLPVAQKFAEDQTKEKIKGMVHVSFAF